MFQISLARERTTEKTFELRNKAGNGITLDTSDKVRMIFYRRPDATPLLDITSGTATANGSSITIQTTVPTPTGGVPKVLLHIDEEDLADAIPGAPLYVEIFQVDNSDSDSLVGPIIGYADILTTSENPV